jgi:hypothetical protein
MAEVRTIAVMSATGKVVYLQPKSFYVLTPRKDVRDEASLMLYCSIKIQ